VEKFFGMALAPFMAVAFLMIARPLSKWIGRKMPDGKLKDFLFTHWE